MTVFPIGCIFGYIQTNTHSTLMLSLETALRYSYFFLEFFNQNTLL